MVSHCTASLKLTPWHEGTFASSVIYSPPQLPPTFPFPSLLLCPTLSPSPPSLSLLPQNDIHYFIVKQESFFSCSPGTKRQGKGEKMRHRQAKSQLGQVSRWQLELFSLWPGAPVENGSVLHCGGSNVTDSLGKYSCLYEAQAAGSGREGRDCLSESLRGFRPCSNHRRPESCLSSLTDMLGLIAASVNTIRQSALYLRIEERIKRAWFRQEVNIGKHTAHVFTVWF